MDNKDNNTFGGFDVLGDMLLGNASGGSNVNAGGGVVPSKSGNPVHPIDEPLPDEPIVDPSKVNPEPTGESGKAPTKTDTDSTVSGPNNTTTDPSTEPTSKSEPTSTVADPDKIDLTEEEPLLAEYLQTKLYEKFGWEYNDDSKLESIDDLAAFLQEIVEDNSAPQYASEELAKLDSYVREGGKLEKYFESRYAGNVDFKSLDLEETSNQGLVLREYFKRQGFSSDDIEKKIQRYEDTGILEDEAKAANNLLTKLIEKESETLLVQQKKMQENVQAQQQKYISDVTSIIDKTQEILPGVTLSATERQNLTNYMFQTDKEGLTQWQKDGNQSYLPFVRAAYLSMTGDKVKNKLDNAASSNAAKRIKERLAVKTKRNKNTTLDNPYTNDKHDYSLLSGLGSSLGS